MSLGFTANQKINVDEEALNVSLAPVYELAWPFLRKLL